VFQGPVGFVNVVYRTVAEALGVYIILAFGNISMSQVDRFERPVITVSPMPALLNARVVPQVLMVVNRSLPDFANGSVNLADCKPLVAQHGTTVPFALK
jgi:hypothetical protein